MLKSLFSCNYDYFEKRASPQSSTGSAFFTDDQVPLRDQSQRLAQ
jgi:hypothetical protein